MTPAFSTLISDLSARRRALGMSHQALSARTGVAVPTVKRILSGHADGASFATVMALSEALGISFLSTAIDPDEVRARQARAKAERIARMVQGTSALEGQAVDRAQFDRLVERSFHELMAGPNRRLWAQ